MINNCNYLIKEYHKCLKKPYNYKCNEILEFLIKMQCLFIKNTDNNNKNQYKK
jgi:hypothetical protein